MEKGKQPAFACTDGDTFYESGLTKREYFAALAMQGILANSSQTFIGLKDSDKAEYSVIMADAILKELEK